MTQATTIENTRREAIMHNRTGLCLEETGVRAADARQVAASLGWRFSHTANLNEFYTNVRPVWWVFHTSTGDTIYLDGDEAARFMAQTGRCGRGNTVETARDGEWEAACWCNGDIFLRRDGELDSVVRMADAKIIIR